MRIAWLLAVALVACGSVSVTPGMDANGPGPDASMTADAGSTDDAPPPDAALPGPVEVTVKKTGVVQQDVEVLFSEADGSAVTRLQTDAAGYTRADLYPGGIVSIVWTDAEGKHVASFYALREGDHVVYDMEPHAPVTADVGMVNFDFATANKPAGTTDWDIHIGCSHFNIPSSNNTYSTSIDSDCVGSGSKVNVLVKAMNNTTVVAFGTAMDLNQVTGNWSAPIVWQVGTPANLNLHLDNAPLHSVFFTSEVTLVRNGIRYSLGSKSSPAGVGQSTTVQVPVPAGFAQTTSVSMGVGWDMTAGPEGFSLYGYNTATAVPDPLTRDLSTTLLPRVNNLTTDRTTMERPAVGWQSDAALVADVLMVDLHQEGVIADDTDDRYWKLFLPPDFVPPVQLPVFPADVAEYAPDTSALDEPRLFVIDLSGADGYRAGQILFGTAVEDPSGATAQETKMQFSGDK